MALRAYRNGAGNNEWSQGAEKQESGLLRHHPALHSSHRAVSREADPRYGLEDDQVAPPVR